MNLFAPRLTPDSCGATRKGQPRQIVSPLLHPVWVQYSAQPRSRCGKRLDFLAAGRLWTESGTHALGCGDEVQTIFKLLDGSRLRPGLTFGPMRELQRHTQGRLGAEDQKRRGSLDLFSLFFFFFRLGFSSVPPLCICGSSSTPARPTQEMAVHFTSTVSVTNFET